MNLKTTSNKKFNRWRIAGIIATILGLTLFVYFIYQVGIFEVIEGVQKIGWGFALIFALYSLRLSTRLTAWRWCLEKPNKLSFLTAFRAMVIGEALSSMIPLGIVISGTAKAIAVRDKLPFWVGLASLATENLFYSFSTAILIILGIAAFFIGFDVPFEFQVAGYVVLVAAVCLVFLGVLMLVKQWKWLSAIAEWFYRRGFLKNLLETGRADISGFEDNIYGFYRRQPQRFLPIFLLEFSFHALGVLEVWLILNFVSEHAPTFFAAFLLETVNRVIIVVFKLVPFVLGVDEAAAQFVTETLQIGAGLGVVLAIIRKGNRLIWAMIGIIFIVRSGLRFRHISEIRNNMTKENAAIS